MTIRDWSTTAGSNSTVGGVNIAEGCTAANLNNAIRAAMADTATWRALLEGAKTTGGTATAQTLTTGLSIASYAVPLMFAAKIGAGLSSTGAAMTLALDGLTGKSVKMLDGSDPPANALKAGAVQLFAYEATADCLFLLTPFASGTLPDPGSNGLVARTGTGTDAARTLTAPAAGITVSNGDGVSGNPTLALANDLSALEAMSGTGIVSRTASETYAQRTITGTSNEVSVTNGDGVSGNPTLGLPSTLALRGKTVQVQDNNFTIADDGDSTKLIAFQASGITAGNTRTITVPDKSGTMAMISDITSGGITTIASGSLSGTNVTITSIPATYAYLVLKITGASSDTATRHVLVQPSTNNGVSYDTTNTNFAITQSDNFASGYYNPGDANLLGDLTTHDQTAAETFTGEINIYGYHGGPNARFSAFSSSVGIIVEGVYLGSTSAINALKILWSGSGSFDAGTYALYGIA